MVSYIDIYRRFKKDSNIQESLIDDYRPCMAMYGVPNIPNAIVVWLTNGSKLIYIYKHESKVVVLCGSSKFKKEHREITKRLSLEGHVVLDAFNHYDDEKITDEQLDILTKTKYKKIDMADILFVVNPGYYIEEQTKQEIEYAERKGKEVLYLEPNGCGAHLLKGIKKVGDYLIREEEKHE